MKQQLNMFAPAQGVLAMPLIHNPAKAVPSPESETQGFEKRFFELCENKDNTLIAFAHKGYFIFYDGHAFIVGGLVNKRQIRAELPMQWKLVLNAYEYKKNFNKIRKAGYQCRIENFEA